MGDGTKENPYTREDVLRLIEENGGKAERLDLSRKIFEDKINLRELHLEGIILKDTFLGRAYLEGAYLRSADIFDAHLEDVDWGNYILGEEKEGEKKGQSHFLN